MGSVEGSERLGLPEARRIVAPRAARCTKFGNLVGLVLSWRTVFALLVLRATCGCCTRAHQGSAVVMLSPSRLDLDPSGPRPAALSTVAHYEKTYRAPQRTNQRAAPKKIDSSLTLHSANPLTSGKKTKHGVHAQSDPQ